jgi:hypothetical protein
MSCKKPNYAFEIEFENNILTLITIIFYAVDVKYMQLHREVGLKSLKYLRLFFSRLKAYLEVELKAPDIFQTILEPSTTLIKSSTNNSQNHQQTHNVMGILSCVLIDSTSDAPQCVMHSLFIFCIYY